MDTSQMKEDIHISYISALCASVGVSYDTQRHDADSTDGIIKKRIHFEDGRFYEKKMIGFNGVQKNFQYEDVCTGKILPNIQNLTINPVLL